MYHNPCAEEYGEEASDNQSQRSTPWGLIDPTNQRRLLFAVRARRCIHREYICV
jgi:hypothetical protein